MLRFSWVVSHPKTLGIAIAIALTGKAYSSFADDNIQFNTDVLSLQDRKNIDLSQFSRAGYIMPGRYNMVIHINKDDLPEQTIEFYTPENDPRGSEVCLSPEQVATFGLKPEILKKLTWLRNEQCLNIRSLEGIDVRGDLATSGLYLNIPQAYMEYTAANWDPPSRWDDGVPGFLMDYNANMQTIKQRNGGSNYNVSGNGTVGANYKQWRLRADWQGRIEQQTGSDQPTKQTLDWNRYYAYRALPQIASRLTLGEDYLTSDIFDQFRFTGMSLRSDDNMLPPNLRGYAPEVVGIARSNATVTISQQGRVLYETQVASGPFRIQDIGDGISGQLEVRVTEQDGSVQEFVVDTATIPYLTRPGMVRYKFSTGRPSDWQHHSNGPLFVMGEFSWGINNGWSLYGGTIGSEDYNALSIGIGRDLLMFGALSFDATQSRARLANEGTLSGGSYRVSYSKRFDDYDSQVTFAGYRFSERDFMSMSEYLDARTNAVRLGNSKEMYTLNFSKNFKDLGMSTYVNYTHQTYWDRADNDRYNISLARYFDIGNLKNISVSLSGYRNVYNNTHDDGVYISLSLPWGNSAHVSYNTTVNRNDNTHRVSYFDRIDDSSQYQVSTGVARSGGMLSGYYNHEGDVARISANAGYQEGKYTSAGINIQGGMTVTPEGGALHRSSNMGGTRLLVDTNGVADVPVRGYGSNSHSNMFGKAVVADINGYYRNQASIDLNNAPDNIEATRSVVQATLTEGAIGYRKFDVISGYKAMASIRLADGAIPPFGAIVLNKKNQQVGLINDNGSVYLSGINAQEQMLVKWADTMQCTISLPKVLPDFGNSLLLPCEPIMATEK